LPAVDDPNDSTSNLVRPRYEYEYDSQGNQTVIRDPMNAHDPNLGGRETRFTFDDQGRQLSRTLPLGFGDDGIPSTADLMALDTQPSTLDFTELFEYDDMGRQVKHTSFEGIVTHNVYSSQTGRLDEKLFFADDSAYTAFQTGSAYSAEVFTHTYDAFGPPLFRSHVSPRRGLLWGCY